jgi:hypothetical protein
MAAMAHVFQVLDQAVLAMRRFICGIRSASPAAACKPASSATRRTSWRAAIMFSQRRWFVVRDFVMNRAAAPLRLIFCPSMKKRP